MGSRGLLCSFGSAFGIPLGNIFLVNKGLHLGNAQWSWRKEVWPGGESGRSYDNLGKHGGGHPGFKRAVVLLRLICQSPLKLITRRAAIPPPHLCRSTLRTQLLQPFFSPGERYPWSPRMEFRKPPAMSGRMICTHAAGALYHPEKSSPCPES